MLLEEARATARKASPRKREKLTERVFFCSFYMNKTRERDLSPSLLSDPFSYGFFYKGVEHYKFC